MLGEDELPGYVPGEPGSVLGRDDLPETVLEDGLAGTVLEEHLTLAGLGGDEDLPRPLLDEENCPEPDEDDLPGTVLAEDDLPWAVLGEDDLLGALLGGEGSLQKRRRRGPPCGDRRRGR